MIVSVVNQSLIPADRSCRIKSAESRFPVRRFFFQSSPLLPEGHLHNPRLQVPAIFTRRFSQAPLMHDRTASAPTAASGTEPGIPFSTIAFMTVRDSRLLPLS
jgi:hypothetical protein